MLNFIVVAIYSNGEKCYISNSCPIMWTDNIYFAKTFPDYDTTKSELDKSFEELNKLVHYTNIESIWILEYYFTNEIGRVKYL